MGKEGLTGQEWKTFKDLMTKANFGQIQTMSEEIDKEEHKRIILLDKIMEAGKHGN